MSDLIPLTNNDGIQAVMGRDLHRFLEVGAEYRHWFPRMIAYGFEEGKDYTVKNDRVQDSLGYEREATNHILTMDTAKELSMVQNNAKGREARQYFFECEKRVAAVPQLTGAQLMAKALLEAESTMKELEDRATTAEAII
ncbi:antA/AntB antirepressor family protein [Corynebacterium ulcerans]|uniref:Antirepressor protein 1 n=1 Tax=Corynebacterium ulcerans TaxID=65058 RepID=A0ABD7MQC8_CORUL|nr:antA/AntB antirepressor family protein [Corynebacterium ulcerans]QQU24945.1 antA/AntB antirepressor family protein [Corynebacterium ulcerans]SNV07077.1 antirepressor protein 1 [Corynebacterium ulcerans]SQG49865.1 antirepressor protein 1 [Corynebacterium ulcerans]SQH03472.1 antirepressor protein 1 [Corynebacterium ulcerans]